MGPGRSPRPLAEHHRSPLDQGALTGALMVCGTTSDSGKTTLVAALCRSMARRGVSVAPFKAQNMALNSEVTEDGLEVGRAQALQAEAALVPVEVAMNPVLLKPTGDQACQVVRMGEPWKVLSAAEYHGLKADLWPTVLDALADLRSRFDVVLVEGAGSPAEINLLDRDIVNLPLARKAGIPALVVGDINLGGVFAALYGTVALLPDELRMWVKGFVINKLRGDPSLLLDGCDKLEARCGVPTLGVIPWIDQTGLDAEDSMALSRPTASMRPPLADALDVAILRLPRISNFTDFDPLALEAGVAIRWVDHPSLLGAPDLIVIPGSKATVEDLEWMRATGLADAVAASDASILGICAGYQMLGSVIDDTVESGSGPTPGLGLLPVRTRYEPSKVTRRRTGRAWGSPVSGYQIHHGRVTAEGGDPFVILHDLDTGEHVDGVRRADIWGTTLHGLFDSDHFRRTFLETVASARGKRWLSDGIRVADVRSAALDRLADAVDEHFDMDTVERIVRSADTGVVN